MWTWHKLSDVLLIMQDLPDTLDCSIPQPTDAITPEEREELKVSGLSWSSSHQENILNLSDTTFFES